MVWATLSPSEQKRRQISAKKTNRILLVLLMIYFVSYLPASKLHSTKKWAYCSSLRSRGNPVRSSSQWPNHTKRSKSRQTSQLLADIRNAYHIRHVCFSSHIHDLLATVSSFNVASVEENLSFPLTTL